MARRTHPFPFRTRPLSSSAAMVLRFTRGRVARCRIYLAKPRIASSGAGFSASSTECRTDFGSRFSETSMRVPLCQSHERRYHDTRISNLPQRSGRWRKLFQANTCQASHLRRIINRDRSSLDRKGTVATRHVHPESWRGHFCCTSNRVRHGDCLVGSHSLDWWRCPPQTGHAQRPSA